MNKKFLYIGGAIALGFIGYFIYKKYKSGGSITSDELKRLVTENDTNNEDEVDIDMVVNTIQEALKEKSITSSDIKKYFDILKKVKLAGNELSLTKEDKDFLETWRKNLNKHKKEKIRLDKIDGDNAVFKLYGEGNPVMYDIKKGEPMQLSNKYRKFTIEKQDNPNDYILNLKKGNVNFMGWQVNKKDNKITKLF